MRFFHLSDLHIGLKLLNQDLREYQEHVLGQIVTLAEREKPDAVVIAGDIYDKAVPSVEAVEVFDRFIGELAESLPKTALMLISGNHDSAPRVNCFRNVLKKQNVYMIGLPPETEEQHIQKVTLTDEAGPVHFYLLPFVRPSMVKQVVGTQENGNLYSYEETLQRLLEREEYDPDARNVLVSHQFYLPAGRTAEDVERMDSEIRILGNIDEVSSKVLKRFDYAALGHIHKPMKVSSHALYSGTPYACSVSEAGQEKSLVMVDMPQKGEISISRLPLLPLRQVRILQGTLAEVLSMACEDYVTVILTGLPEEGEIDVQDRLRAAFPYLLEIRREQVRAGQDDHRREMAAEPDPYALCCEFLRDPDDEEQRILQDVIRKVWGESEG
ncbi:MAG: exonuclease SbcCD subunit D [Blautia sp.]|nr:exonuclease SbcCD subunit D [Blautia sp.]